MSPSLSTSTDFILLNTEFYEDKHILGIEFYVGSFANTTLHNKTTTLSQNVTVCNTTRVWTGKTTRFGSGKSSSTARIFTNVTNCTRFLNSTNITTTIVNTTYVNTGKISIKVLFLIYCENGVLFTSE